MPTLSKVISPKRKFAPLFATTACAGIGAPLVTALTSKLKAPSSRALPVSVFVPPKLTVVSATLYSFVNTTSAISLSPLKYLGVPTSLPLPPSANVITTLIISLL